ncbi:MAG: hypothetical protein ACRDQ4_09645 [Pseudonocardiaceae bacterium]
MCLTQSMWWTFGWCALAAGTLAERLAEQTLADARCRVAEFDDRLPRE